MDKFLQAVFAPIKEPAEVEHLLGELENILSLLEIDPDYLSRLWEGEPIPRECWERIVLSCISQLKELGAGGKAETAVASWLEERAIRNARSRQSGIPMVEKAIESILEIDEL